jgi:acetyltransferase-like isoleucine patch superfamily enzyme
MADCGLGKGSQIKGEAMRKILKVFCLFPILVAFMIYRRRNSTFLTTSRLLAMVPGEIGVWLRFQWYKRTLAACGNNLYVDWMAVFKTPKTRVGSNVFIGTFCWIGWANIGDEVMLGGHITILSGSRHHLFEDTTIPMTQQPGSLTEVKIGSDVWVGNGAIIMADVSTGTVIGAGAVVNKTFPPYSIIAGVPAKVIGCRKEHRTEA